MYLSMLMFSPCMHAYLPDLSDLKSMVESVTENLLLCLEHTGEKMGFKKLIIRNWGGWLESHKPVTEMN